MKNIITKILIITVAAILALGSALTFVNFDFNREMQSPKTWEAFSPDDGRFHVNFPKDPVKKEEELRIANAKIIYNEYTAQTDDAIYSVSYMDFPGSWKLLGTNKLLKTSFEKLLEQEEGVQEVIRQEIANHQGNSALEFHYRLAEKEVRGKLVVKGNTLYRVHMTYLIASAEKIQQSDYIDSFDVMA